MKTTIKVSKETSRRLNKIKYKLDCSTHDETINRVFDIVDKIVENQKEFAK